MHPNNDPAFPVNELQQETGAVAAQHFGISQRALIAAILMHAELTTCGVPGEACDALIAASAEANCDPVDHMALNSVEGADSLLRALADSPPPAPEPMLTADQRRAIHEAPALCAALKAVEASEQFSAMSKDLQKQVQRAIFLYEDDILF